MSEPQNLDNNHHDDIVEEDNPLPRWWVLLFIGTLIFAVIYVWFYQFGPGLSQQQELDNGLKKIAAMQHPKSEAASQKKIASFEISPAEVASGKSVFDSKCSACHGPEGQGTIGPNLTDSSWIHGDGTGPAIYQVIHDGVTEKGMLAWKDTLSEADLHAVTIYVMSLKGTHPSNPKAAEGTAVGQ